MRGYSRGVETSERLARDLRTRYITVETKSAVETSDWCSREGSDVVHRRDAGREDKDAVDRNVERSRVGEDFCGGGKGESDENFSAFARRSRENKRGGERDARGGD